MGQGRRSHKGTVGDLDAMVNLVSFLQASEDADGIFHGRLIHEDRLEPPLQCGVLFDVFTVLIQRCGADTVQLASGQHGLQHVACVHGTVGLSGSDDQVQLIDKQDDRTFALSDLFQNGLQTLLKFAPVLGACHKGSHIQRKDLLVLQAFRNVSVDDPLGQSFYHGGLADAGLTDQDGVVFRLTGQDPYHIPDLGISADDRIKLLGPGFFDQVLRIFCQCIVGGFRVVADHPLIAADSGQCLQKTFHRDSKGSEQLFHGRTWISQQRKEQMFHRDILVSHTFCLILRAYQGFVQILPETQIPSGYLDFCVQRPFYSTDKLFFIDLHLLDQLEDQAVFLHKE